MLDGGNQIAAAGDAGQIRHARLFAGEVDAGADDAVAAIQGARHILLAHGAGHAGDRQVDGRRGHAVAGLLQALDHVAGRYSAGVVAHRRSLGRQIDRDLSDAIDALEAALDILDAHGAGHAGDRQRDFFGRHGKRSNQLLISLRIFCISFSAPWGSLPKSCAKLFSM